MSEGFSRALCNLMKPKMFIYFFSNLLKHMNRSCFLIKSNWIQGIIETWCILLFLSLLM